MSPPDTVPPAFRASDAEREHAIRLLREGSADGRLSPDTFLHRVDLALRARRAEELAGLLTDLPPAAGTSSFFARTAARWAAVALRVQSAWRSPRVPSLVLPREDRTVFTIGRAPESDLAVPDISVSRRHAELRHRGSEWVLADLGSTNGTRVNGWRVRSPFTVRAGDRVTFGRAAFRIADQH